MPSATEAMIVVIIAQNVQYVFPAFSGTHFAAKLEASTTGAN